MPTCEDFSVISSPDGHDGFLIKTQALTPLFSRALDAVPCPST